MLSNARGKHSSPGVYIEEIDKSYATKSLGITTLGVVGETLRGPAFEPIRISDWKEFQEYFGGTSTEKFRNGYPKYELPYIAKSYLKESKQLEVCRVLGLSGYNAGPAWVIYGQKLNYKTSALNNKNFEDKKYVIAIIRSKAEYNSFDDYDPCADDSVKGGADRPSFKVKDIAMKEYQTVDAILHNCSNKDEFNSKSTDSQVSSSNYGKFTLNVSYNVANKPDDIIPISLDPNDKDYIVNMIGMQSQSGNYDIFLEELYDLSHIRECQKITDTKHSALYDHIFIEKIDGNENKEMIENYQSMFSSAVTPWFVSDLKGISGNVDIKKLFRFHTISDGNAANSHVKISVSNILPDEGLFDILVRDYNDTDGTPIVLERFAKCSMIPGTSNYIGLQIGTYNGDYANKSKYVTVEVIENDLTETCVPCGFLGYPMRKLNGYENMNLSYNTSVLDYLKPNKQYFGMSDITGVDLDVLLYKGKKAYTDKQLCEDGYSNGFHLDSYINIISETKVTVDGVAGYNFTTPDVRCGFDDGATYPPHISSEVSMQQNVYADKRLRKFTCYFYGGFDGWDIYRKHRTNTGGYKANKYKGVLNVIDENSKELQYENPFTSAFDASLLNLSGKVINSDYYAYLAGYKQFDNPNKIKINLLATPGIDYVNNLDLFNEVLDIVEESRQGDCLYIVTTPDADIDTNEIDADKAVSELESSEINTSYAATYYPWVKYYDESNKKYINLPVTKDVVRNFAYTDNVSHPWFASAGMSRGDVECVKATHFTKQDEEDMLYEGMINPVKSFGANGVKIWGNKTMYKNDTPLNRINVRRLMIRVKDLVMTAATQLIFEQNDDTVESQFRSIVEPILATAKQNRGISDYKLQTDRSPEARDRKELPAKIWLKPINCLEYIPISFVVTPEGASFED